MAGAHTDRRLRSGHHHGGGNSDLDPDGAGRAISVAGRPTCSVCRIWQIPPATGAAEAVCTLCVLRWSARKAALMTGVSDVFRCYNVPRAHYPKPGNMLYLHVSLVSSQHLQASTVGRQARQVRRIIFRSTSSNVFEPPERLA